MTPLEVPASDIEVEAEVTNTKTHIILYNYLSIIFSQVTFNQITVLN